MPGTLPAINCSLNITATSIKGDSVACQFNAVNSLLFDYFKGTLKVIDITGEFTFSLTAITTLTYTVAGKITTIVMS